MEHLLPYLPILLVALACPVSMGLMMWFMMRQMQGGQKEQPSTDQRIAELEREVQSLRARRLDRTVDSTVDSVEQQSEERTEVVG